MIAWLNPGALVAIAAAGLPVVVHLLLRTRAARVVVPSVRFISSTRESAIRIRRPSDTVLLLVRMLILVCAALALAAPVVITESRTAGWMNRVIRAIVVDTSASVDPASAAEAAAAQSVGAFETARFEGPDIAAAIRRAATWLRVAAPGRQELVLVSDFQHGAVSEAEFAALPSGAGILPVTVGRRPAALVEIDGGIVQFGARRYAQEITIDGAATSYRLRETQAGSGTDFVKDASGSVDLGRLARTVAAAGIFVPRGPAALAFTRPGTLARGSAALDLDTAPDSLETATEVHQLLAARPDLPALGEAEPMATDPAVVKGWYREARAPEASAWRRVTDSDARWFWLAALVLLAGEALVRRDRSAASAAGREARAA
jgi:hypothetical protein